MSGLKKIVQGVIYATVSPLVWMYLLRVSLLGEQRAFSLWSESIARVPGLRGIYFRHACFKHTLAHVGQDVHFGFMSLLSKPQASIGDRVYIGRFCTLGLVEIHDDVMIADAVQILSGGKQHGSHASEGKTLRDNQQQYTKVTLGKGAWIGAGAIVMADVGEGAIVGAGAVVTKPVAPHTRVGGVPAKLLGPSQPQDTEQNTLQTT